MYIKCTKCVEYNANMYIFVYFYIHKFVYFLYTKLCTSNVIMIVLVYMYYN